jgi:UDP-glucuronate decarboxylase
MIFLENDIEPCIVIPEIQKLEGKKLLFTGGSGFLGAAFFELFSIYNSKLASDPIEAVFIDVAHPNRINPRAFNDKKLRFKLCDVRQFDLLNKLGSEWDFVVHAAGIASPFYYRAKPLETIEAAYIGLRNVLELTKVMKSTRVTFFSSSEIYGDPDESAVPIMESYRGNVACIGPRACYDESKRLGETLCYVFHEYFGLHTNIIRPFNIYGPGMLADDYRVIPNFAAQLFENKPLYVYGSGHQTRTFCYLTDAIKGFLKVITSGVAGEPYNIGNPNGEISMLSLAQAFVDIGTTRGYQSTVVRRDYPDSYPADEPMRRCPDITKARRQLDFDPTVSLNEGLSKFLDWARVEYVDK